MQVVVRPCPGLARSQGCVLAQQQTLLADRGGLASRRGHSTAALALPGLPGARAGGKGDSLNKGVSATRLRVSVSPLVLGQCSSLTGTLGHLPGAWDFCPGSKNKGAF